MVYHVSDDLLLHRLDADVAFLAAVLARPGLKGLESKPLGIDLADDLVDERIWRAVFPVDSPVILPSGVTMTPAVIGLGDELAVDDEALAVTFNLNRPFSLMALRAVGICLPARWSCMRFHSLSRERAVRGLCRSQIAVFHQNRATRCSTTSCPACC